MNKLKEWYKRNRTDVIGLTQGYLGVLLISIYSYWKVVIKGGVL